jgi:hypothetical protein
MPSCSSEGLWLLQLMHHQESYCGGIDSSIPYQSQKTASLLKLADKILGEPEPLAERFERRLASGIQSFT